MAKGRTKRGAIDWDSGHWLKEEWRPQAQGESGSSANAEEEDAGPTTSKQPRLPTSRSKKCRSPQPNKEQDDGDDSDSIDDALFWEEKQRLFWKNGNPTTDSSGQSAEKVNEKATTEIPLSEQGDQSHTNTKASKQQDAGNNPPKSIRFNKNNMDNQQQQDPTESTELGSSGASSEGPSLELLVNEELDDIQQQLDAIERKLNENQMQLEECLKDEEEDSSVQIFEDDDATKTEQDETATTQRKMNALLETAQSSKIKLNMSPSNLEVAAMEPHSDTDKEELASDPRNVFVVNTHQLSSSIHAPIISLVGSEEEIASILTEDSCTSAEENDPNTKSHSEDGKSERRRRRRKSTSEATRATHVAATLSALLDTIIQASDLWDDTFSSEEEEVETFAQKLVQQLERMLDRFVQFMDGLEIMLTFGGTNDDRSSDTMAQRTIETISANYAPLLEFIWEHQLQTTLQQFWKKDPEDAHLMDLLYRIALILKGLAKQFSELFFIQKRPFMELESNVDVKAIFVTFFELLRRDAWAVTILLDSTKTPEDELSAFRPSLMLQLAWNVNGDSTEWQDLFITTESEILSWDEGMQHFRGLCCDWVMRSSNASTNLLGSSLVELLLEYSELDPPAEQSESDSDTPSSELDSSDEQSESDSDTEQQSVSIVQESLSEAIESFKSPVPQAARLVLQCIQGDPQPRECLFDEILSQLVPSRSSAIGDGALTKISLSGGACVGKTTLAAMVAYTPLVHKVFSDGIVWIGLNGLRGERLRYDQYISCLYDVLEQLGFNKDSQKDFLKFPEHMHVPGETPSERARREIHLLSLAKAAMAKFLRSRRVLFILDNIGNHHDLALFEFDESLQGALLVTTRFDNLLPSFYAVRVETLQSEEEAFELFANECNTSTDGWDSTSPESEAEAAGSLALKCCFHPMAMAVLGRFLHLQGQQLGTKGKLSLAPTDRILASFGLEETCEMLFSILNMSLSSSSDGAMTSLFNFSLVAFVKVFCSEGHFPSDIVSSAFPEVPVDIVELLFESILVLEEEYFQEEIELIYQHKEKAAELIVYVLSTLGVLSRPTNSEKITLAHSIYKEYVDCLLDVDATVLHFADPTNQSKWHRAIVANLLDSERDWRGSQLEYTLESLPHHMICAEMYLEAGDLVADLSFVRARVLNMGLFDATKRQIRDIECLLTKVVPGASTTDRIQSRPYYRIIMQQAYSAMMDSAMDPEPGLDPLEVAGAFVKLGTSFSEWGCYEEAIGFWSRSLEMSVLPMRDVSVLLSRIGAAYAKLNDFDQALRPLSKCLLLRGELYGKNENDMLIAETAQIVGDIHCATKNYSQAANSYSEALGVLQCADCRCCDDGRCCTCTWLPQKIGDLQQRLENISSLQNNAE